MASRRLRVGTRGSALALAQARLAVAALRAVLPPHDGDVETEVVVVHAQGDRDAHTPLSLLGGRGVFVRELEGALLDGRVDVAVHSLKDVPTALLEGCALAATLPRGDVRDALVSRDGVPLALLPAGSRVGTASLRRSVQLRALRPDLEYAEIRGNVDTRIRKVREGAYGAVVLAWAGLDRLGRRSEAAQVFTEDEVLPAPGQAAIALEVRADDEATRAWCGAAGDGRTWAAVTAERTFLATLGAGCHAPVGCLARFEDDLLVVTGLVGDPAGRTMRASLVGSAGEDPADLGLALARRMLLDGADALLAEAHT